MVVLLQTVRRSFIFLVIPGVVASILVGCGSGKLKARKEEREHLVQTAHIYCDFINGEQYTDVEVMTNIEMAKHCDSESSMTVTSYHSPSDAIGLVYCCRAVSDLSTIGKDKDSKDSKGKK